MNALYDAFDAAPIDETAAMSILKKLARHSHVQGSEEVQVSDVDTRCDVNIIVSPQPEWDAPKVRDYIKANAHFFEDVAIEVQPDGAWHIWAQWLDEVGNSAAVRLCFITNLQGFVSEFLINYSNVEDTDTLALTIVDAWQADGVV